MTVKVKYNRELLEQICERDKCIVDFDKIQEYNQKVVIEFICSCGSTHKKYSKIYITMEEGIVKNVLIIYHRIKKKKLVSKIMV